MQRDYWAAFHQVLDRLSGPISGNRKPQPQSWMSYPIGRSEMHLGTVMVRPKKRIRVERYPRTEYTKAFFHLLQEQKADIEEELGFALEWEELPDRRDSRIALHLDRTDAEDREDWVRQHEWLAKSLNEMRRVFADRVRAGCRRLGYWCKLPLH